MANLFCDHAIANIVFIFVFVESPNSIKQIKRKKRTTSTLIYYI